MLSSSVISFHPNNCSSHPVNPLKPSGYTSVTCEKRINRQSDSGHDYYSANTTLNDRDIEVRNSQEPAWQHNDVFSELKIPWNSESPGLPYQEADDDINSWVIYGRHDKIINFLQQNDINTVADGKDHPLVTAICYGSLETALLLLQQGANPNTIDTVPMVSGSISMNHILKLAPDIPRITLLLSYGANPCDDHYNEISTAIQDQRITHLLVYYYWQLYCTRHSDPIARPDSVAKLHHLVLGLPLLKMSAIISLFKADQLSLTTPPEILPQKVILKAFFEFVNA